MIVLPEVTDISYFTNIPENTGRSTNDHNNKVRENIICCMSHIDNDYLLDTKYGLEWSKLKSDFEGKIKIICSSYHSYKIQQKAGRGHNYDYLISFYVETKNKI